MDSLRDDMDTGLRNKPSASAFKQQKLPAWQPILTAGTVLPTFFLIGIAFIPIGFGLLLSSNQVKEIVIDYTNCISINPATPGRPCSEVIQSAPSCTCRANFTLFDQVERDVYVYYGLTNFYQNHRRYVRSRDDKQLLGIISTPNSECNPYAYLEVDGKTRNIIPCGAIANSIFNDTFTIYYKDFTRGSQGERFSPIALTRTGIAWATDKSSKFRNPVNRDILKELAHPPYWNRSILHLDTKNPNNNGLQNEALMVWMRTAALPSFRKLYARVNHTVKDSYQKWLPKGEYHVEIEYLYPVTAFKGTKTLIISNTSWLGGKNSFLGVAYVGVGFICLILSGVFLFIHRKFGRPTSDLLSINQRTPYLAS